MSVCVLARQAIREIVRARVVSALFVFVAIMAWGSLFAGGLTFESRFEVGLDMGLSGAAFFGAVLAILLGHEYAGSVGSPVHAPSLAAGIGRARLLAGRWLGTGAAVVILSAIPPLALSGVFRVAGAIEETKVFLSAAALLPLEALLVTALTAALTVSFPRAWALSLAFGLWVACHMHPDPFAIQVMYPGFSGQALLAVEKLAPDLEAYNARVYEAGAWGTYGAALLQTTVYTLVAFAAAALSFREKDL